LPFTKCMIGCRLEIQTATITGNLSYEK